MKIGVVGTGYVGIVTGSCLADKGFDVLCFDVDEAKIAAYSKGKSVIYEPGLEDLIKRNLQEGRLNFTTDIRSFIEYAEVIFLCVGTPPLPDGSADLSQVETAVRNIAEYAPPNSYKIIVEKSTVPVGTHKRLQTITRLYNKSKTEFDFVVNSEFLREGSAIGDFLNPDRVVIGLETEKAKEIMLKIYSDFDTERVVVDPASAEIIKYASNSFLAMKISFINTVADLCEKTGADIGKVADGIGFDKRIGRAFLNAGIGYGGSCFPKDVKAFINVLDSQSVESSILKAVESFNRYRPNKIIKILEEELWILKDKDIAVWGLAFKPETDDIREAPSLNVVSSLIERGVNLKLYDPEAKNNFEKLFPESDKLKYATSPMEAIEDTEALIILTEWDEFKKVKPDDIFKAMKLPVVVDGRNVFAETDMIKKGFRYFPIGKGKVFDMMKKTV
jgi:UDPglucose 6-dehydrogenase